MVTEKIRKAWESADFHDLAEIYAPDALLDVTFPQWRFQVRGTDAITGQFREWYPAGAPKEFRWEERPTAWGAVVEAEEIRTDAEGGLYSRWINVFVTDGDRITNHVLYCSGMWDEEAVAHQKAHAPMVGS